MHKRLSKPYIVSLLLGLLLFLFLLPYFLPTPFSILFNQHFIEHYNTQYNAETFSESLHRRLSFYTLKLNTLFHRPSQPTNFSDIESMFSYVFESLPYYSIIYPTEYYYYYTFSIPNQTISGNLRLVELDNGKVGMGYFDKDNVSQVNHKLFSVTDGLTILKRSDSLYKLTYNHKTVYFRLPVSLTREQPQTFTLLPEEQLVAKIREESGLLFYLIFHNATRSFYYVLDEDRPVLETLLPLQGRLYRGERSDYIYYSDPVYSRKLLLALLDENVYANNYYDGPFDQVPPFLPLRDMIYRVYPYTQYGSGIDFYGNFLDWSATRVAISPYQKYTDLEELYSFVAFCEEEPTVYDRWSCLAFEDKKVYHLASGAFTADGALKYPKQSSV